MLFSRRDPEGREGLTGAGIGADCEAYVAGWYAEHLIVQGRRVPPWAWLNQAAHADAMTIAAAANGLPDDGHCLVWTDARAAVAALIVAALASGADLHEIQQEVLVPLEIDLRHETCTPESLTRRVYQALA